MPCQQGSTTKALWTWAHHLTSLETQKCIFGVHGPKWHTVTSSWTAGVFDFFCICCILYCLCVLSTDESWEIHISLFSCYIYVCMMSVIFFESPDVRFLFLCCLTVWCYANRNCRKLWKKKACGNVISFHFSHSNCVNMDCWWNYFSCQIVKTFETFKAQGMNCMCSYFIPHLQDSLGTSTKGQSTHTP